MKRTAILLVFLAILLAGCAAPAATQEPAPELAAFPAPIHEERDVAAAAGATVAGQGECTPNRPCFDTPFTLARPAVVSAKASWTSAENAVALELRTGEERLQYAAPALGATSVGLSKLVEAGEFVLRVHAYRMANDRYALDVTFLEPPAVAFAPACDPARPAVAHAADAAAAASERGPPTPCLFALPGETVEPTIGVDPATGAVFFYPIFEQGGGSIARSLDEGATWDLLKATLNGNDMHSNTLDPYLYLDPATGRVFVDDLQTVNCSMLSWSDDGGATWDHSPVAGCMEFDHQTLFAGPPALSPTIGYPNVVYRCAANTFALTGASTTSTCQRSLDGGRAWLPPGEPAFMPRPDGNGNVGLPAYCDGLVGHGAVGADGAVYLPKGWCGEPWLAVSQDEGLTWTRTLVSDKGFLRATGGFHAHDAGVGIDADGNVYYGWIAADRMPYVAVSRDGGASFEPARMVAPPGVNEASHPELIAGGAGKLAFLYLGSTNSPGNFTSFDCLDDPVFCATSTTAAPGGDYTNTTWNAYVTVSLDGDAASPTYWTVSLNDPADPLLRGECGVVRCGDGHDFFDIRIGPDGTPWVALGDSCIDACIVDPTAPGGNRAVVGRVVGVDLRAAPEEARA